MGRQLPEDFRRSYRLVESPVRAGPARRASLQLRLRDSVLIECPVASGLLHMIVSPSDRSWPGDARA